MSLYEIPEGKPAVAPGGLKRIPDPEALEPIGDPDPTTPAETAQEGPESLQEPSPVPAKGNIPPARKGALAKLEGLITPETGLVLAELAGGVPADHAIVELGAYKGKSAAYLAEGAKRGAGAQVYSVDPWDTRGNITGRFGFADPATYEAYLAQIAKMGLQTTPIKGFSVNVARTWPRDRPIGLLYIDGSHRYYDVRADFQAWSKFVAVGGLVVFDDYFGPNHGVKRAADWAKQSFRGFRSWDYSQAPLAICRRAR
jgi:predicted O-methyltransferase YrrM